MSCQLSELSVKSMLHPAPEPVAEKMFFSFGKSLGFPGTRLETVGCHAFAIASQRSSSLAALTRLSQLKAVGDEFWDCGEGKSESIQYRYFRNRL
jgi:hypothetical protein